jgi:UPF0042 nucleotide-binding protein
MSETARRLVVVTGLSGSGKSIALHALEDLGFYCIDNLPVSLFEAFTREMVSAEGHYTRVAIGIDARNRETDLSEVASLAVGLRERGINSEIIFLEADDDVLIQRFSETRRRHPLTDAQRSLQQAIALERELLDPLLLSADLRIDTTHTNLHQLRKQIRKRIGDRDQAGLSLLIESFGFKQGIPSNADFVFDARCLVNPHWQLELRPLTGRDRAVEEFLRADSRVLDYLDQLGGFLERWVPDFEADGRSYLTIAIGCTGGQHRSVFLVEQLADYFRSQGRQVLTSHRELE